MAKRMFFIYNPKAGKAKIREYLVDILDVFANAEYEVTVYPTRFPGDAKNAVKNVDKSAYDLIVCCGGDGTLDDVVTGMLQCEERLKVGYIPAGSTNDFARSLGISNNMVEAAEVVVGGKTFSCDVGEFNEEGFVYIAAFGAFTEVSYATDQGLKNAIGHMAYILEGAKSISSLSSYQMKVECKGEIMEGDYIFGMVTNSTSVGGFKNITGPDVALNDGEFEVTLVRRPTNLIELNNILVALVTRKMDAPCMRKLKTDEIRFISEEEVKWTLDGEFGGAHKDVYIKNDPGALEIIVS